MIPFRVFWRGRAVTGPLTYDECLAWIDANVAAGRDIALVYLGYQVRPLVRA